MGPRYFYRVHDSSSATSYSPREGFTAGDRKSWVRMFPLSEDQQGRLRRFAFSHLKWMSRIPSPFISVYSDLATARHEARARAFERGKEHVMIAHIRIDNDYNAEHDVKACFRHARAVARSSHTFIPRRAWHNTQYEHLFFRQIPEPTIYHVEYLDDDGASAELQAAFHRSMRI